MVVPEALGGVSSCGLGCGLGVLRIGFVSLFGTDGSGEPSCALAKAEKLINKIRKNALYRICFFNICPPVLFNFFPQLCAKVEI